MNFGISWKDKDFSLDKPLSGFAMELHVHLKWELVLQTVKENILWTCEGAISGSSEF